MSTTISVRLTREQAEWLEATSRLTGVPRGKLIRDQLDRARDQPGEQPFWALCGILTGGPKDLSSRKGFSRK